MAHEHVSVLPAFGRLAETVIFGVIMAGLAFALGFGMFTETTWVGSVKPLRPRSEQ